MTIYFDGKLLHDGRELAALYGMCYETIRAQSAGGILPFVKIGRKRYYSKAATDVIVVKHHSGITITAEEIEL